MEFKDDRYPPLISPRSPSYSRAWRAFHPPSDEKNAATVALLARLSEAEGNASRICKQVAPLLGADPFAELVHDHGELHNARRQALAKLIERIGGAAPTDAESRVILTQSCDAAGHVVSVRDAKRVLNVMRSELGREYDAALQNRELDTTQRSALADLVPDRSQEH